LDIANLEVRHNAAKKGQDQNSLRLNSLEFSDWDLLDLTTEENASSWMDEASDVSDLNLGVLEANSTISECNIERLSSIAQHEVVNRPDGLKMVSWHLFAITQ
jgi:hypothetical protein